MFERFTRNARAVVIGAQEVAQRHAATEVRPAHLLESLVSQDGTLAMQVLAGLGAPGDEVAWALAVLTGPVSTGPPGVEALSVSSVFGGAPGVQIVLVVAGFAGGGWGAGRGLAANTASTRFPVASTRAAMSYATSAP